jgi:16S rRNA U1498 N3-methylase RsmE
MVKLVGINPQGEVVRIQGDEFWHMTRVLRLGINDRSHCFHFFPSFLCDLYAMVLDNED